MERGEQQQRPVSCPWWNQSQVSPCPWSHLLLKSRDVPVNYLTSALCARGYPCFSMGEHLGYFVNLIEEKHGCQWICRRFFLARGYDSFENPGLTSLAFALSACAPSNYSWQPGDIGQLSDTYPAKWDGFYPWCVHTMPGKEVMTKWKLEIMLFICTGGSVGYFTSYRAWIWIN